MEVQPRDWFMWLVYSSPFQKTFTESHRHVGVPSEWQLAWQSHGKHKPPLPPPNRFCCSKMQVTTNSIHSYFMISMIMNGEFVIDINLCYSFQMTNRLNRKTNQLKHGSTSKFGLIPVCEVLFCHNALQAGSIRVGLTTPSPTHSPGAPHRGVSESCGLSGKCSHWITVSNLKGYTGKMWLVWGCKTKTT